jgi:uncharacterized protein YegL
MSDPFGVDARGERASVSPGKSSLWAAIEIAAKGRGLEKERAPLALVLAIDVSPSMAGDPIAHVLRSCELIIELLDPRDHLAIVAFGGHAQIVCGLVALDQDGRAAVTASLRGVQMIGSTNIHAGLAAAAGLLATAPAQLRRAVVLMSDGQPNVGMASATELANYTRGLRPIGVSALGFGLHHDENVLVAIASAGSGRYAYVPDPIAARVDLARAALAHGGIVADSLELRLKPAAGVELVRVVPAVQLRHGGAGVAAAIGDVFVDESRVLAIELALDLEPKSRGPLAEIVVEGRLPDGTTHRATATLVADVHAGPHAIDRDAQRAILLARAEATRSEARAHADRGALPAAASLLRELIRVIEASEGFVRDDGTPLAEMREQLEDEAANYERRGSDAERAMGYSPTIGTVRATARAPGALVGLSHEVQNQRFDLFTETRIGRTQSSDLAFQHASLSRAHARIVYVDGDFVLQDLGSTNGCEVNGLAVALESKKLVHGDIVKLGFVEFRFERK